MISSACMWSAAIGIPVVVMIILDAFDTHTPSNVAFYSSLLIFFVFVAHNIWLGGQLKRRNTTAA